MEDEIHNYVHLCRLWKILEGNVSYLSQACVALLIACQEDSIALEVTTPIDVEGSELAKTIRGGLNHKKWKNVVKTGMWNELCIHACT